MPEESWQAAFNAVVLSWLRADQESAQAWRQYLMTSDYGVLMAMARRGQLSAGDDLRTAMWGVFRYQRSHADAMRETLTRAGYTPRKNRLIIDFGCGAGTAAVAVTELVDGLASVPTIRYLGLDHNESVLQIGSELLGHSELTRETRIDRLATSFGDIVHEVREGVRDGFSPMITISYLLRQSAVDDEAIRLIAGAIAEVVRTVPTDDSVTVVTADATNGPISRLPALRAQFADERLREANRWVNAFATRSRYPNLNPETEGWYITRTPWYNNVEWTRTDLVQ